MRLLTISLLVALCLYLAVVAAMFMLQRQLQYFPSNRGPTPAEAGFTGAAEHILTAADGTKVKLWYAPAPEGAPTILFFQGNGGEIADRDDRWTFYRDQGFGAAFLSWRGYGGSEGRPTETGLHQDAAAAMAFLKAQGVGAAHVVLVGKSLGTGIAVRLAADQAADTPVAALVLEAPYTSTADVAARQYPWLPVRLLMLDQYRSIDHIGQIDTPLFVFHGDADQTIPFALGRHLFEAAPAPKEFLPAAGRGHEAIYDPATWMQEANFIWRVWQNP